MNLSVVCDSVTLRSCEAVSVHFHLFHMYCQGATCNVRSWNDRVIWHMGMYALLSNSWESKLNQDKKRNWWVCGANPSFRAACGDVDNKAKGWFLELLAQFLSHLD